MRDRHGVVVEHVGDMTTTEKLSYERGYNSITREYIDSKDGEGTMDRIWAEVDDFRTEQYRRYLENNPSSGNA
jgi:hypothetical protein